MLAFISEQPRSRPTPTSESVDGTPEHLALERESPERKQHSCCRLSCRLTATLSGIPKCPTTQITSSVNDLQSPCRTSYSPWDARQSVGSFITRFSLQSTAGMSENSGTDARFPYEHRQNVVVRLCMLLLLEQEVPDSNRARLPGSTGANWRTGQTAQVLLVSN